MAPGVEPVVCGKPEAPFAALAAAFAGGCGPVLMVGDNPGTDVALAERLGWDSLLVLTGSADQADPGGPGPTFVAGHLTGVPAAVRPPAG
jgi:ribonucleotide monophosphatase NagD (HAD superfamily)